MESSPVLNGMNWVYQETRVCSKIPTRRGPFFRFHEWLIHIHYAFTAPFVGSMKQPDMLIQSLSGTHPSIVFEVEWTEMMIDLHRIKDLLLQGFGGAIKLVVLIKWDPNPNTRIVKGDLEVATTRLRQTEVCFEKFCFSSEAKLIADHISGTSPRFGSASCMDFQGRHFRRFRYYTEPDIVCGIASRRTEIYCWNQHGH
jgi:hypothetical protein